MGVIEARSVEWLVISVITAAVVLMQTSAGTVAAYWTVWLFIGLAAMRILHRGRVHFSAIVALWIGSVFIVYQVRPGPFLDALGYRDMLMLLPSVIGLALYRYIPDVDRVSLYKGIIFASWLVLVLNIAFFGIEVYPTWLVEPPYAGIRWVGGMNGPNEFAQVYVSVFAICLGLNLERRVSFFSTFLVGLVTLVGVFITFSRGGLVVFFLIALVYFFLQRRLIYVGLYSALALLVAFFPGSTSLFKVATDMFTNVRVNASDRDMLFEDTMRIFLDHFLFGGGFGIYGVESTLDNTSPHSDYLYFITSGGLIAIVVVVFVMAFILRRFYKAGMYAELIFFVSVFGNGVFWNGLVRPKLSILVFFVLVVGLNYAWRRGSVRGDV